MPNDSVPTSEDPCAGKTGHRAECHRSRPHHWHQKSTRRHPLRRGNRHRKAACHAGCCRLVDRGQITGGILDGPLAFDNAVSIGAAAEKGILSPVAGMADILVVPDLEAGNMLAKPLTFLAGADAAGIVLGARIPIILTSRADSARTRIASCAVAVLADRAAAQA
jgi:phosphotransacetylase